jgi:TRAP-type uncharacterized transport system fused permease subunit
MTTLSEGLPDAKTLQALEEKYDPEVRFRPLLAPASWIVPALLFVLSCFHYYTAGFGLLQETLHRGIHMSFVLGLIFLVFAFSKSQQGRARPSTLLAPGGVPLQDWALGAIAAVVLAIVLAPGARIRE